MNKIVRMIGTLVLAILSISVPVMFGVSIGANWHTYIITLLGMGTISEICIVSIWMYFAIEEEE